MVEAKKGYTIFYDKDRPDIMTLYVVESNTKDDKCHPVNIQQKEEAEAFAQFSQTLMQDVNSANGITDIKAAKKESRKWKRCSTLKNGWGSFFHFIGKTLSLWSDKEYAFPMK